MNNTFFIIINILPLLLLQIIVTLSIFIICYFKKSFNKNLLYKTIFINYIFFLVGINVFPIIVTNQNIPFKRLAFNPFNSTSIKIILNSIILILLFIPFGIYIKNFKNIIFYSILLGISIEFFKFLGRFHMPNLGNIIFYVLGSSIGYKIYKIYNNKKVKKYIQK